LLAAAVVALALPIATFFERQFLISQLFDIHWYAFKQEAQRRDLPKYHHDDRVALISLRYPNRVDFWFDQSTKKKLADSLRNYDGPILLNLQPSLLLKDAELRSILENPKVIKPFNVEPRQNLVQSSMEIEKIISKFVDQDPLATTPTALCPLEEAQKKCLANDVQISPHDADYFEGDHYFGSSAIILQKWQQALAWGGVRDLSSQLIYSLPLVQKASRLMVPSPLLAAVALGSGCQNFRLHRNLKFDMSQCLMGGDRTLALQNPLPLFFYFSPPKAISLDEITPGKILLVEINDSAAYLPTAMGTFETWGTLMATALSNILQGHTPQRPPELPFIEFGLLLFGLLFLVWRIRDSSPMSFFISFFGILVLSVVADFSVTYIFNMRTHPVDGFLAFSLVGFVGFGLVIKREFDERKLIEQAFSGYVSSERLNRLLTGREKLAVEGQRRELTTLMIDIVGFSKMVHDMSIENVFRLIQKFFSVVDPVIFKHSGVIDKKMGDGMLTFFGDDLDSGASTQSAAILAVTAAIEIQRVLENFSATELGLQTKLRVRIGVNTGLMMVGNAGSQTHFNYTVLGEAVNFTQRLEAACAPSQILVGESTARYIKDSFELVETQISAKNETEKFTCFKVIFDSARAMLV
jgi:class 3 adenylate cyclase